MTKTDMSEIKTPGQSALSATDVGILEETVKDLLLDALAPFTGDDAMTGLTIWIDDQIVHIVESERFLTSLKAAFDSMRLRSLGSGEIKVVHGAPGPEDEASPLSKGSLIPPGKIWFRLHRKGLSAVKSTKAAVSVYQGIGSLKEKEYLLDAQDKTVYRIGRGAVSRKPGAAYRVNDIIIEENNPNTAVQKLNDYVSSSQADILLEDGAFFLRATPSGSRMSGGSPTKIIRDGNPIELRDPLSSYRLKDGDLIELGKSVLLLFRIIG